MKRFLRKIFILLPLVCILTGLLSGCKWDKREDVIPAKLGTQEGLWMYYKDQRLRTDGSERQDILQTVKFAEKSYNQDSFKIQKLIYLTNIKTIVFVISVFDEAEENGEIEESESEGEADEADEAEQAKIETKILYRYNYKEKTGEPLYTLPSASDVDMYLSDSYLYVTANDFGILFNTSLELIGENFDNCILSKDLLYRCTKKIKDEIRRTEAWMLEWYRDGVWQSAWLDHTRTDDWYQFYYAGDYIYAFNARYSSRDRSYYELYVNLKTGEQAEGNGWVEQVFVLNNQFFICDFDSNSNPETYTLYSVEGMEFTPVYTFQADLSLYINVYYSDADYFYLEADDYRDSKTNYYKMDRRTHQIKGSKQIKERDRRYFEITVGGYTFYQSERSYGLFSKENCVYLYREKNGKTEAMRYKLSEDVKNPPNFTTYDVTSRLFYNDICEF